MPVTLPPQSVRWLADHHGVITTQVLREHGIGATATRRLVERGVLRSRRSRRLRLDVDTAHRRAAVRRAVGRRTVVVSSPVPTAGMLAGLRRMPRRSPIHYSVLHGVHLPDDPGVRFRQTTVIWAIDRRVRDDGIVVASWPRLAFDLAADLPQLDHVSVVQQLLHEGRVTRDDLVDIDRRLGHPARAGSGVFSRTVHSLDASPPNESHPEVVLAEALRRRGVPVVHQTKVLRPSNGREMRVDLAVPDVRWGIELDIHPEHRTVDGFGNDARRRTEMHMVGWQVETVTEVDMADVNRTTDRLVAAYHVRRCHHPSAS